MNAFPHLLGWMVLLLGAVPPAKAGEAPREVSFATADSGTVFANLYGSGERGVVLAALAGLAAQPASESDGGHEATQRHRP